MAHNRHRYFAWPPNGNTSVHIWPKRAGKILHNFYCLLVLQLAYVYRFTQMHPGTLKTPTKTQHRQIVHRKY